MASRVSDLLWLTDAQVRSEAAARSEIPRSLAGLAYTLTELATGAPAVDGEPAQTPRNPQGARGCDLSGPPWGSALRQPIAWISGRKANTAQVVDHSVVGSSVSSVSSGVTVPLSVGPWGIWVRPHETLPPPAIAPFSRGYIMIRAHGPGTQTTSLITKAWNLTLGETADVAVTDTGDLSITTTESSYDLSTWVNLAPGFNLIRLLFLVNTNNHSITIDAIAIEQRAKRSH